jgi:hypothetical protein
MSPPSLPSSSSSSGAGDHHDDDRKVEDYENNDFAMDVDQTSSPSPVGGSHTGSSPTNSSPTDVVHSYHPIINGLFSFMSYKTEC